MTTVETMQKITMDGKRILRQVHGKTTYEHFVEFDPNDFHNFHNFHKLPSNGAVLRSIFRSILKGF